MRRFPVIGYDRPNPPLDSLGLKYATDKNSRTHDYCRLYDELFTPLRHTPIKLLELGVCYGQSMRMWADYFTDPGTLIFGIDNHSYGEFMGEQPAKVWLFDGEQDEIPRDWPDPMLDIVIDDASHDPVKTQASFQVWWPQLRPGGFYVVEDISNTDLTFLNGLVGETAHRVGEIEWMRFSHDLCILRKTQATVVFPTGTCPGSVLSSHSEKHLWIGSG